MIKEHQTLQKTLRDLKSEGKVFHALTYNHSTLAERQDIIRDLNSIEECRLTNRIERLLLSENEPNFSLYLSTISTENYIIVHATTLGDYRDFATHDYQWWKNILKPYVRRKQVIDNSDSCTDSWLDNQLKII